MNHIYLIWWGGVFQLVVEGTTCCDHCFLLCFFFPYVEEDDSLAELFLINSSSVQGSYHFKFSKLFNFLFFFGVFMRID